MVRKRKPASEERSFLEIDKFALDEEWLNQPKLFKHYSDKLADAREDLDVAKNRLELVTAEIDLAIRDDPKKYGIEKVTEGAIKNNVILDDSYQEALTNVSDCKHAVDVLAGAVTALDQRKKALENLVTLYGQSYFATPQARTEVDREAVDDMTKKATRKKGRKTNSRT